MKLFVLLCFDFCVFALFNHRGKLWEKFLDKKLIDVTEGPKVFDELNLLNKTRQYKTKLTFGE